MLSQSTPDPLALALPSFPYFLDAHTQAPDAARRFLDAVETVLHAIAANPEAGHRYLNAKRAEEDWRYLRLPGFKKYFAFYRISELEIEVVRIVHGSRDLDHIFSVLR